MVSDVIMPCTMRILTPYPLLHYDCLRKLEGGKDFDLHHPCHKGISLYLKKSRHLHLLLQNSFFLPPLIMNNPRQLFSLTLHLI